MSAASMLLLRAQARILLSSSQRPASYMRMFYVSSQATKQVAARLREGEADDVAGYVIDLRNNPGAFISTPCAEVCCWVHSIAVWVPYEAPAMRLSSCKSSQGIQDQE